MPVSTGETVGKFLGSLNWRNRLAAPVAGGDGPPVTSLTVSAFLTGVNWRNQPRSAAGPAVSAFALETMMSEFNWD